MTITHLSPAAAGDLDAVGQMLTRVQNQFADLVDAPVWSLDDTTLVARVTQALAVKAATDEFLGRLVGEVEDRGLPRRLGASSTAAHLVGAHRVSRAEARQVMGAVRQLHRARGGRGRSAVTEPVRRAQAAGQVSAEQAVVIASAVNQLDPSLPVVEVEQAQHDLIGFAGELLFADLARVANRVVEVVDPDGADQLLEQQLRRQERAGLAGCELMLRIHPDGTSDGRFTQLPAVPTAMLKKALDALTAPRRSPTTAQAVGDLPALPPVASQMPIGSAAERLDRLVDTQPDQVPYPNRRGRAFAELVEHLAVDGLPQHGTSSASVVVTIEETKLRAGAGVARLDTGVEVSVGEARRLGCNAGIVPMVLSGQSRVLDLGTSRRLFDRYQRLALAHRDQGCVFPGCERPPAWCEAHHLHEWSRGGPTDLANGALVCGFHHHLVHAGEWDLVLGPDGIPEAIPPARVDPQRRPIRHSRRKPRPG